RPGRSAIAEPWLEVAPRAIVELEEQAVVEGCDIRQATVRRRAGQIDLTRCRDGAVTTPEPSHRVIGGGQKADFRSQPDGVEGVRREVERIVDRGCNPGAGCGAIAD